MSLLVFFLLFASCLIVSIIATISFTKKNNEIIKRSPKLQELFLALQFTYKDIKKLYSKKEIDYNHYIFSLMLINYIYKQIEEILSDLKDERKILDQCFYFAHKIRILQLKMLHSDEVENDIRKYYKALTFHPKRNNRRLKRQLRLRQISSILPEFFTNRTSEQVIHNLVNYDYIKCKTEELQQDVETFITPIDRLYKFFYRQYKEDEKFSRETAKVEEIYKFFVSCKDIVNYLREEYEIEYDIFESWSKVCNVAMQFYEKGYYPIYMYGTLTLDNESTIDAFAELRRISNISIVLSNFDYVYNIVKKYVFSKAQETMRKELSKKMQSKRVKALNAKSNKKSKKFICLFIINDGTNTYKLLSNGSGYILDVFKEGNVISYVTSYEEIIKRYSSILSDSSQHILEYYETNIKNCI